MTVNFTEEERRDLIMHVKAQLFVAAGKVIQVPDQLIEAIALAAIDWDNEPKTDTEKIRASISRF